MKSRISGLGLLTFALAACAANAQEGEITARTVHEESGEPFSGVLVAVDAPQYYGRYPTNSDGIVQLPRVPAGTWKIEFNCPSANYIGRRIETEHVTVKSGKAASINVAVPENYCHEPAYSEVESEFRGYVIYGDKYSSFKPCDADSLKLSQNTFSGKNFIWVGNIDSKKFALQPDTRYYIEFKGTLQGPGRYGHLDVSDYNVTIEKIKNVFKVEKRDCKRDLHAKE